MALRPGEIFAVEIEQLNPEVLKEFSRLGEEFSIELEKTFKALIIDVNKYLIRITPIDTGQLRGGWTAFLDSERISYSQQIFDISLAIKARGRDYRIDPSAVEDGKRFSTYTFPNPLTWEIINSVPYAFYLEHGTSQITGRNFVSNARYKAELRFTTVFNNWFNQIAEAGKVVPFKSTDEDITS